MQFVEQLLAEPALWFTCFLEARAHCESRYIWEFPKIRGTLLGVGVYIGIPLFRETTILTFLRIMYIRVIIRRNSETDGFPAQGKVIWPLHNLATRSPAHISTVPNPAPLNREPQTLKCKPKLQRLEPQTPHQTKLVIKP